MTEIALLCTYLGVVCCYAASPTGDDRVWGAAVLGRRPGPGRLVGGGLLGWALVLLTLAFSPAVGLLIGLSAAIMSASIVVIAAPLVPRLIPTSVGLFLLAALLTQLG